MLALLLFLDTFRVRKFAGAIMSDQQRWAACLSQAWLLSGIENGFIKLESLLIEMEDDYEKNYRVQWKLDEKWNVYWKQKNL